MSALSDYLEAKYLDLTYNGVAFTPPAAVYIALYTADPTDADTGTEVSGSGYARAQVNPNGGGAPEFNLAITDGTGKMVTNAGDIEFPAATAAWGTVTHFGVKDAATGGNLLHHGALDQAQTVNSGGIFRIAAGDLKLRME
ncbi:MAG: hypothetical protein ABIF77_18495 [bacterium]